MSNNKVFNVNNISTPKYPRFKNPIEYLRNLSKKYGNKSVTYLEYIFGLKDDTYSNLFKIIYFNNFTEYLISYIKVLDYKKLFDQSKCLTVKFDKKITCIRNKAIYFRILFYYFSASNENLFAEKANKQFFIYFNKFLKLKKKTYSENLVLNFLDIIFKDLFNNDSFKKITIDSIKSVTTLKKYLTILIDIRSTNNQNKNKNLISILNIIIRCKIKEIITDNKKPKQNHKYKISNKQVEDLTLSQIPIELNKQVKNLNSTKKTELINFIIELQHLNQNQKTNLISRITNSKVTKNEIQNMLNKYKKLNFSGNLSPEEKQKILGISNNNWIKHIMDDNNFEIFETNANGNCLYHCLKLALNQSNLGTFTIDELRQIASNKINQNLYIIYLKEYTNNKSRKTHSFMRKIKNLNDLKNYSLKKEFWADDYIINIFEKHFNINFIIVQNYMNSDYILCSNIFSFLNNNNINNTNNTNNTNPKYYIMVLYNGDHYKLIIYNGQTIFDFNNIPDVVKIKIITTCMENQNSIYSKIPDFIKFKNNLNKN
jgi:hypothetical protein